MEILKNNFIFLRKKSGLNQAQLSLSLGFSKGVWNNYERGKSYPNLLDFIKITNFFHYSATDLIETDLWNVALNPKTTELKKGKNVALNVAPNVALNECNEVKQLQKELRLKDDYIALKDQLIERDKELIASQAAQIMLLQNHIDTMKFEIEEKKESHATQREQRKTA